MMHVVWQPILAAGGLSGRLWTLAIQRVQRADDVGQASEATPGFSPTFFGFVYSPGSPPKAREIRRVSKTAGWKAGLQARLPATRRRQTHEDAELR